MAAANDPACWYTGRTITNADGSRTFDWEGTQVGNRASAPQFSFCKFGLHRLEFVWEGTDVGQC